MRHHQSVIAEKIPLLMAKVEEGYALTGQALRAVQQHMDVQKRQCDDFAAFMTEYHGDKVIQKYALAAINNLGARVRDIACQVSGSKADVNNSVKSLSQKLLSEVIQLNNTTKSNHTSWVEAVKGIKEGLTELARAVTRDAFRKCSWDTDDARAKGTNGFTSRV